MYVRVTLVLLLLTVVVVVAARCSLTDHLDHQASILDALTARVLHLETQLQHAEARASEQDRNAKELCFQLNELEGKDVQLAILGL